MSLITCIQSDRQNTQQTLDKNGFTEAFSFLELNAIFTGL